MDSKKIKKKVVGNFIDELQLIVTDKGQDSIGPRILSLSDLATMICSGDFDDCKVVDFDRELHQRTCETLINNCPPAPEHGRLIQCEACFDTDPDSYTIMFWLSPDND